MAGPFVSRAGLKLAHALTSFATNAAGLICADLGCNVGGFTDCLLQNNAARVYAIDTGYGVLDWKLRNDPRVRVMERTNAMHVRLPERVDLVTIDVAWTRQRNILPAARRILVDAGQVITLIKPHYEAGAPLLRRGVLPAESIEPVLEAVKVDVHLAGFEWIGSVRSPIRGASGNLEILALLRPLAGTLNP